jgi:hypothetical protein
MAETLVFEEKEDFLLRLRELKKNGHSWRNLRLYLPWHLPEVEEILEMRPGALRYFAFFGGFAGFVGGMGFTIYTVLSWPLITGGKPPISIPPFLLISYILTILAGSLATFFGFLFLARLPSIKGIRGEEEYGNRFVIVIEEVERPW